MDALVRDGALAHEGVAVRRLFAVVDADHDVLVDGDATYDPATRSSTTSATTG